MERLPLTWQAALEGLERVRTLILEVDSEGSRQQWLRALLLSTQTGELRAAEIERLTADIARDDL